jgi:hypothetical protein
VKIMVNNYELSAADEEALLAYFAFEPLLPGFKSSFGAMYNHLNGGYNAPEAGSFEDAMIAYVDARASGRRVEQALNLLTRPERDTLQAHYNGAAQLEQSQLRFAQASYARARRASCR